LGEKDAKRKYYQSCGVDSMLGANGFVCVSIICVGKGVSKMSYIIISPWSKKLRDDKPNPKNYPIDTWITLVEGIRSNIGCKVIQIGVSGELPILGAVQLWNANMDILGILVEGCSGWISVDNFFQHFVASLDTVNPGIVLWTVSDPEIFGVKSNINLLKDRKYLRPNNVEGERRGMDNQFLKWDRATYNPDAFVPIEQIFGAVHDLLSFHENVM
jgi:hypothetical protein